MTCSITSSRICSLETSGSCWVEMTTVWTRTGAVALVLDRHLALAVRPQPGELRPTCAALARRWVSRWARAIGSGISSGVSRQAKPNISPWSPAPPVSTPWAMSGDCGSIADSTPQVA